MAQIQLFKEYICLLLREWRRRRRNLPSSPSLSNSTPVLCGDLQLKLQPFIMAVFSGSILWAHHRLEVQDWPWSGICHCSTAGGSGKQNKAIFFLKNASFSASKCHQLPSLDHSGEDFYKHPKPVFI